MTEQTSSKGSMADQSAGSSTAALPAAPDAVGKAFIAQYYNILHSSPERAHEFYQRAGKTVLSQSEIDQSVTALGGCDLDIEIIDAKFQKSYMGGVFVTVTGLLCNTLTAKKRKFVQSFLLAPQSETALSQHPQFFFVINDILWYLDDEESQTSNPAPMLADGLPMPSDVPIVTEAEVSSPTHHEAQVSTNPTPLVEPTVQDDIEIIEAEDVASLEDSSLAEGAPVSDEPPVSSSELQTLEETVKPPSMALPAPVSSSEEGSKEAPKQPPKEAFESSYREILLKKNPTSSGQQMKEKAECTAPSTTSTASPKATASPVDPQAATSSLSPSGTNGHTTVENKGSRSIVDERSVFVRNFPCDVSIDELREQLSKFGLVQAGRLGVTVKREGRYAFVQFEESASARTAIASRTPIFIGGRQVSVEGRRTGKSRRAPRTG